MPDTDIGTDASEKDDLVEAVRARLRTLIPPGGASVLAFQPIPTPLDPQDYLRPGTEEVEPIRAGIQLTLVADAIGEVVDGNFVAGTVTASGLFGLLLAGTATGTEDEAAVFGHLHGAAEQRYTGDPHLISATPQSWCAPGALGWSDFGWSQEQSHTEASPVAPGRAWKWRVLAPEFREVLNRPQLITQAVPADTVRAETIQLDRQRLSPVSLARSAVLEDSPRFRRRGLATTVTLEAAVSHRENLILAERVALPVVEQALADPRTALRLAVDLDRDATPHTADSTSMSVSFQYALVMLNRPWWDGLLVRSPGWQIAGYEPGSLSPGPDQTASAPHGLPIGMVLVRNVDITGAWSTEQTEVVESAMSFGPFSLLGRKVTTEKAGSAVTVRVDGTQLFAWLVELLPELPPGRAAKTEAAPFRGRLRAGSKGPEVELLQRQLSTSGYPAAVTGVFDEATRAAVTAFQRARVLEADGIVGPQTWAALFSAAT